MNLSLSLFRGLGKFGGLGLWSFKLKIVKDGEAISVFM